MDEGKYFDVAKIISEGTVKTSMERACLVDALNRARTCMTGENMPIRIDLSEKSADISVAASTVNYTESLPLNKDIESPLAIAFDSRLLIDCLKAFDDDEVGMSFAGPKAPLIIREEGSEFLALILPVALKTVSGGVA